MTKTLLIMAGGTGGHIMPGLAIAETMQARGWDVRWLGTQHGMENRLVPPRGIEMFTVDFSGLRGKGLLHSFTGIFKFVGATLNIWRYMCRLNPGVVLGMGGYVTVPGGFAARMHKLPLAVVNADASLLMSNKALANSAQRVLFGFEGEPDDRLTGKSRVTGNPVRAEIAAIPAPEQRFAGRNGPLNLLVIGGSLGAKALNEALPKALALIPADQRPVVTHQAGTQHAEALQKAYDQAGIQAKVLPFIDDIATAYANADLLICRAGAITISELAVAGVPSILVPLVVSTTSHQRDNAEWMASYNAAIHLPQDKMSPDHLARLLQRFTREELLEMAQAARKLGKPDATEMIANELEEIALP
jgi:UDP-N-acetylglucosamine--N-acetylmuramyl-(pentapeptide) pyrophosphoryl-undecaprenol N-acetylglucosamine transferase